MACPAGTFLYTIKPNDTLWMIAQRYNTTIGEIATMNPRVNLNYLYIGQMICVPIRTENYQPNDNYQNRGISNTEMNLINQLRLLWEQHVEWTRMTVQSIILGLPDTDLVSKRLLRNPNDFADVLRIYYGDEKANKFAELLKGHLEIAAQLVKAAKTGDNKAVAEIEKRWYANADEIADFLGSINPNWSKEEWRAMMHEHLSLLKTEVTNILTKNYAAGVNIYDEIEKQALKMADVMAKGIAKQFPDKF